MLHVAVLVVVYVLILELNARDVFQLVFKLVVYRLTTLYSFSLYVDKLCLLRAIDPFALASWLWCGRQGVFFLLAGVSWYTLSLSMAVQ